MPDDRRYSDEEILASAGKAPGLISRGWTGSSEGAPCVEVAIQNAIIQDVGGVLLPTIILSEELMESAFRTIRLSLEDAKRRRAQEDKEAANGK